MYISFSKQKSAKYKEYIFKLELLKSQDLKDENKYKVFTSKDEIRVLNNDERININNLGQFFDISTMLLKEIIKNDELFSYTYNIFKNNERFIMSYREESKSINLFNYSKINIYLALDNAIIDNKINLTNEELKRFNILKTMVTYQAFLQNCNDYIINIDGINYQIQKDDIISFLDLPTDELLNKCNNTTIKGIPTKHFIYAINEFVKTNSKNFLLFNYLEKCNELVKHVDIFSINKIKNNDLTYQKINLNEEFVNYILETIPNNYTIMEMAIYIYIKLCKTLTYSSEYYLFNKKNSIKEKYNNLEYINHVSEENNNIVCFQFNIIFQAFLHRLGIQFNTIDSNNIIINKDLYGKSHLKTEFAVDEYIIQADAVRYIYFSDLDNLKINKPITGLICLNPDKDLKEKFNETVNKIYESIQLKEKENNNFISLDILLEKYKEYTNNDENISIEKKIHILTKIVKECNFSDIDTLSILTQLSELVFGKKIDISYLKNNKIDYPTYIIIVAIKNNNRYIYYYLDLYNENLEVYNITSSELQRKLNMSIYETNERYLPKGLKK